MGRPKRRRKRPQRGPRPIYQQLWTDWVLCALHRKAVAEWLTGDPFEDEATAEANRELHELLQHRGILEGPPPLGEDGRPFLDWLLNGLD